MRTRTCTYPAPKLGGENCTGPTSDVVSCPNGNFVYFKDFAVRRYRFLSLDSHTVCQLKLAKLICKKSIWRNVYCYMCAKQGTKFNNCNVFALIVACCTILVLKYQFSYLVVHRTWARLHVLIEKHSCLLGLSDSAWAYTDPGTVTCSGSGHWLQSAEPACYQ